MATPAPEPAHDAGTLNRLSMAVDELEEAGRQLLASLAERLLTEQRSGTEGGLWIEGRLEKGRPRWIKVQVLDRWQAGRGEDERPSRRRRMR